MTSSLASQLSGIRSLNADRLASTSALASHTSYLFPQKIAVKQDLHATHSLGSNGWEELCNDDARLRKWDKASLLFGEESRSKDRLMLGKEENEEIDEAVREFLRKIGPVLTTKSAAKCLEWLVRRFRIHEFSVEDVLGAFLPYHETPQFARMLKICKLKKFPHLAFLLPIQKVGSPLPASVLQTALLAPHTTTASMELVRWVASLLDPSRFLKEENIRPHRILVSFWTSTLIQLCVRWAGNEAGDIDGGLVKSSKKKSGKFKQADAQVLLSGLLPAVVQVAEARELGSESRVGAYMVLCAIGCAFSLSIDAVRSVLASISKSGPISDESQAQVESTSKALLAACFALCASPVEDLEVLSLQSQPQDRLLPDGIVRAICGMDRPAERVMVASKSYNLDSFTAQLLASLIVSIAEQAQATLLEELLLAKELPTSLILKALDILLQWQPSESDDPSVAGLSSAVTSENLKDTLRNRIKVLSAVRQTRPEHFDTAAQSSTSGKNLGEAERQRVWKVIRAVMSIDAGISIEEAASDGSQNNSDVVWLGINAADASQRQLSLENLFDDVEKGRIAVKDAIVKDSIKSRIQDSSRPVLKTLYSKPDILLNALKGEVLLSSIAEALGVTGNLGVEEMGLHLQFLVSSLIVRHPRLEIRVFQSALWPRLLWTGETIDVAKMTSKIVFESKISQRSDGERGSISAMLKGVARIAQDGEDIPGAANESIADSIASEISATSSIDAFNQRVAFIISQARGGDQVTSSSQLLAIIVLIRLLSIVDQAQFLPLSRGVIESVALPLLSSNRGSAEDNEKDLVSMNKLKGTVSAESFAVIYRQPSSAKTLRRLAAQLMQQVLLRLPVPSLSSYLDSLDTASKTAVEILGTLYAATSSPSTGPVLSRHLLRTLLSKLSDSSLPFLASVWTAPKRSIVIDGSSKTVSVGFEPVVRLAALRHAGAFLHAFASSTAAKDFQTIVPALLVALKEADASLRLAALDCFDAIASVCDAAKKGDVEIFGYEKIYGHSSSDLQYLDFPMLGKYVRLINERRNGFRNDPNFVTVLHQEVLEVNRQDGRKEVNFKHATICYLLSHIVCWNDYQARLALLECLQGISDHDTLKMLMPLLRGLRQTQHEGFKSLNQEAQLTYAALLFGAFNKNVRTYLEDQSNGSWSFFLEALSAAEVHSIQVQAVKALQIGLFTSLKLSMRQEVVEHLASIIADPGKINAPELQSSLRELDIDAQVLVPVLASLRDTITTKVLDAPEAKRARVAVSSDDAIQKASSILVTLLESAASRKLRPSGAIVLELFEVLRVAVELHTSLAVNAEYLLQLSMTCLSNLLDRGTDLAADVVPALRADTIVNAIKASSNPQTFQHALLLLAKVATLAPESVLHNVMPIFTFVGSTVLQRDDSFSFTVVERTLKSIIPALVASLKRGENASKNLFALLCEARAFIRIFTDAATHVPRHRRQVFFRLLVEILGAQEFLAAICMLLVDRSAHKVIKQDDQGVEATLQLPLVVMQAQPALVQLRAINQIWEEAQRIWSNRANRETLSENVFLDRAGRVDREHSDNQTEPIRQVLSLIAFIEHAIASRSFAAQLLTLDQSEFGDSLAQFIHASLALSDGQNVPNTSINDAARQALTKAMPFVPVESIMSVISSLVSDKAASRQCSGFSLFASRIASMGEGQDRVDAAKFTPRIMEAALAVLRSSETAMLDETLRQSALDAIKAVSATALQSEHGSLAASIPVIIAIGKDENTPATAQITVFSIARRLTDNLGPRLIPHVASLVPFCLSTIEGSLATAVSCSAALRTGAFDTLAGLFTSIPTFMTKYLSDIIRMSICPQLQASLASISGSSTAGERSLNGLVSALVKKTPSQQVFDSIFKVWEGIDKSSRDLLVGIFAFLARALRQTDRAGMQATYKSIFRFMLKALDMRRERPGALDDEDLHEIEDMCLRAFVKMVMKLNETSFRPLFLRTYDWAVLDLVDDDTPSDDEGLLARQMVLYKLMNVLSDNLKSLVSSYYATMLDQTIELLQSFGKAKIQKPDLWREVVSSILKSARYDEGSFWNPSRLSKIAPPLVSQLNLMGSLGGSKVGLDREEDVHLLVRTFSALAQTVSDEASLKLVNGSILTKARSEEPEVRVACLKVITRVWAEEGEAMLGLVPETVASLSELLDDDDQRVAEEAAKLREMIEVALGEPLDSYLQ